MIVLGNRCMPAGHRGRRRMAGPPREISPSGFTVSILVRVAEMIAWNLDIVGGSQ
jgi:hypothetical protein